MKFITARGKFLAPVMGSVATVAALSTPALVFADSVSADSSLVSAAQGAVDQITANVNGVVPIALGLMGAILGITIGISVFKKLTNKSK